MRTGARRLIGVCAVLALLGACAPGANGRSTAGSAAASRSVGVAMSSPASSASLSSRTGLSSVTAAGSVSGHSPTPTAVAVTSTGHFAGSPTATPTLAPAPATATPAADQSLALLQEAFTLLIEKFFKPLNSKALLTVAWQAAVQEAQREGSHGGVATPNLSGNATADLAAFSRQYLQLVAGMSGNHAQVAFQAAQQMTASLREQHTYFLTPDEAKQFTAQTSGQSNFVGIGITITSFAPPFLVSDVFPNSPAQQAGVRAGDQILRVNGKSMATATGDQLTAALTGAAGSTVALDLKSPTGQTRTVTVTRQAVYAPLLESRVLADHMCYLQLHSFPFADQVLPDGKTVLQELDADLSACRQAGVTGWILDLRGNPGGADVERFASRFIANGVLSTSKDRLGAIYQMAPTGHLFPQQEPLAVLVDGGSASSSEILASAVQDQHRGIVVGTHSAGIVNGTELIPLPLGAVLGVAVEQLLRDTSGGPLDGHPVVPDVNVNATPPTAAQLAAGTDNQISRAAETLATVHEVMPPVPTPAPLMLTNEELERQLGPLLPATSAVPTTTDAKRIDLTVDTIEGYASDNPILTQAEARALRVGFRGELVRRYGPIDSPNYTVGIGLYATAQGAHDDLAQVYQPGETQNPTENIVVTPPATFGDETVARVGTGPNTGTSELTWRHGAVIFDLQFNGNPGEVPFAKMVTVARAMEALYRQHPVQ